MGEVIPFPRGRSEAAGSPATAGPAAVALSENQCRLGLALLTWDPARRVIHLTTEPGCVLTGDHARAIGAAVTRWVGRVPAAPYAFLIRGSDADTDLTYRTVIGRGARRHAEHIRLVFYGGTEDTRFVARMYVRGVRVGAVCDTLEEAWEWLADNGF